MSDRTSHAVTAVATISDGVIVVLPHTERRHERRAGRSRRAETRSDRRQDKPVRIRFARTGVEPEAYALPAVTGEPTDLTTTRCPASKQGALHIQSGVERDYGEIPDAGLTPHGVEIGPVSKVELLGCSPKEPDDAGLGASGAVIETFNVTGTDLTAYPPTPGICTPVSGATTSPRPDVDSSKNYRRSDR